LPPVSIEYTVRDGDTLSSIAAQKLGKRGRWNEIYELNRDRVKDPDSVAPGTVLKLPSAGSRGGRA
jgi:nucleoid-associated protein YgaU